MPPNIKKLDPLARLAYEALDDMKGQSITVLDVMKLTTVTDTMIICTGTSNRHVKSLAQSVAEEAKHAGFQPLGMEGTDQGEWVLVDLGGVVVHVMQAQARAFYQLEKLWAVAEEADETLEAKPPKAPKPKKPKIASSLKKAAAKSARGGAAKKKASGNKAPGNMGAKKKALKKAVVKKPAAKKAAVKKAPAKKAAVRKK
ncbi:MAG: ribosome silencing factor [Solimonas sp.]